MDKLRLKQLKKELVAEAAEAARHSSHANVVHPVWETSRKEGHGEMPHAMLIQSDSESARISPRVSPPSKKQRKEKAGPFQSLPDLGLLQIKNLGNCVTEMYSISDATRLIADYISSFEPQLKEREELAGQVSELSRKLKEAKLNVVQLQTGLKGLSTEYEDGKKSWEAARQSYEARIQSLESAEKQTGEKVIFLEGALASSRTQVDELESLLKEKISECDQARFDCREERKKALEEFEKGYAEALAHLKFLHPDEDLSRYNPWFEVVDGQLKDPDEDGMKRSPPKEDA